MRSSPVPLSETLYSYGGVEKPLTLSKFRLCGLGEKGKDCGKVVMTDVDIGEDEDDIRAVKFTPLNCLRIECPECYHEWAMRQTFEIALRVETMALIRGERPYHVVFSIHPKDCSEMTWTDVNQRLWRRGVRRLRYIRCDTARKFKEHTISECPNCYAEKIRCNNAGGRGHRVEDCPNCYDKKIRCKIHEEGKKHNVEDCPNCHDLDIDKYGGIGIFHPFRVRAEWKSRWGRGANADEDKEIGSGRYWQKIRANIESGLGRLEKYAKIGFHAHNWVFTDGADKQTNEDYLIKFSKNFKQFDRKEVVALTRYLVTHTATLRETTVYKNHTCTYCGHSSRATKDRCGYCGRSDEIEESHAARNRVVHPVRSYGVLHRFDPKEALIEEFGEEEGTKKYHELAENIANILFLRKEKGEMLTMEWDRDAEELVYPAYHKEFTTSREHENWVSIWELFDLASDYDFMVGLSNEKYEFVDSVVDYLKVEGKPPPAEECSPVYLKGEVYIPDSITVIMPKKAKEKFESDAKKERPTRLSRLRQRVVELLQRGEKDMSKINNHLPEYGSSEVSSVLKRMCERGEIIMIDDMIELNIPTAKDHTKQVPLIEVNNL